MSASPDNPVTSSPNDAHHEEETTLGDGDNSDSMSTLYPADGLSLPVARDVLQAAEFVDGTAVTTAGPFVHDVEKSATQRRGSVRAVPVELTTRRELFAWWMYYFAYEPMSVVAMVLLIPLLLQRLAQEMGHLAEDVAKGCLEVDRPGATCVFLSLGRWDVTPSSFAYYTIGTSVAAQAVTFVSVGALADYGRLRKQMLILCTVLGGMSAIAMALVLRPTFVWLAAGLTIAQSVFFGTASVFYNAYLPLLVQSHPKFLAAAVELDVVGSDIQHSVHAQHQPPENPTQITDNRIPIHPRNHQMEKHATPSSQRRLHRVGEKLSNFISTVGIAVGYLAGILMLLAVMACFAVGGTGGRAMQLCIAACGLWWLVFSCVPLWVLKSRPGPPLPPNTNYLSFSWGKLRRTLQKCRRLPTTFSFLICYFFFSDGYSTMGSAAILIAKQSMDVSMSKLTLCALIAPICALIGTVCFLFVQRVCRLSSKTMLVVILLVMGCIPLYCAIGIVSSRIGLHREWEIYAITATYGLLIGAVQSFARVLFAELIPPGEEAEFFSLYAVTDKGSALLGPFVIAILADYTKQPRYGLIFLALLILLPVPFIIRFVSVSRGKQECMRFIQQTRSSS